MKIPPYFPQRMKDLRLGITMQASEPHFAVDPAWPPHGHEPESDREKGFHHARSREDILAEPYIEQIVRERQKRRQLFILTVECPVCHAAQGKKCSTPRGSPHIERRICVLGK